MRFSAWIGTRKRMLHIRIVSYRSTNLKWCVVNSSVGPYAANRIQTNVENKGKFKHVSSVSAQNFADCRWVSYYSAPTMALSGDGWLVKAVTKWSSDWQPTARCAFGVTRAEMRTRLLAADVVSKITGHVQSDTVPFLLIIRSARRRKRTRAWILSFVIPFRCSAFRCLYRRIIVAVDFLRRLENKHVPRNAYNIPPLSSTV